MDGLNRQEHLDSWSPTPPDRFQVYPTVETWFISFPYRPLGFSFVFSNRCLCMSRFAFDSTQSFRVWILALSSTVSVYVQYLNITYIKYKNTRTVLERNGSAHEQPKTSLRIESAN